MNQGATYAEERAGGYLWAPRKNKAGNTEHGWTNVSLVKAGDIVVHYDDTEIHALSVVKTAAIDSDKPGEMADEPWAKDGWHVSVQIQDLPEAVPLSELPEAARPAGVGPFTVSAASSRVTSGTSPLRWPPPSPRTSGSCGQRMVEATADKHRQRRPGGTVESTSHLQEYRRPAIPLPRLAHHRLSLALGTKPFVLLSGISGTGKTKLAQLVAEYVAPPQQMVEAESGTSGRRP